MAEQLLVAGRIHNIINILEFIKLPGKEVKDLLKDFIKYIIELYIGPNCDIEIDKEVIKQP
jgi:hypothetical protein